MNTHHHRVADMIYENLAQLEDPADMLVLREATHDLAIMLEQSSPGFDADVFFELAGFPEMSSNA